MSSRTAQPLRSARAAAVLLGAWLAAAADAAELPDAGVPDAAPAATPESPAEGATLVRAPRPRRDVGATSLPGDEARHLPLALGDTLAVVQSLPGVARAPAGSSAVLVWGAAPAETRVVVDDVPVPWLYHRLGLRSALSDALVSGVELVPGGFGPDQGRATGGLVRVATTQLPTEGWTARLGADVLDCGASLGFRQAAEVGPHALVVGGRYGWLSRVWPRAWPELAQAVPLPESWDYGAKWLVRSGETAWQLLAFGAGDVVDRRFAAGGGEHRETAFHRVATRLQRALDGGARVEASLWVGADLDDARSDFGTTRASQARRVLRAGLRASLRQSLGPRLAFTLGADVEASRSELERLGTLGLPAREGDLAVFGQPPGDTVAFDRWTTHTLGAAAFAELELTLGSALTLRPGLRLEPFVHEGERLLPRRGAAVDVGFSRVELFVEPRLSASLRVAPWLTLSGAFGLYRQPPDAADLSAVFGNPALGSTSGLHAVLGATVRPLEPLAVELTGFFTSAGGLAARTSQDFPAVAQALVDTGESRAFGAQVVLRPAAWRWLSGWASYTLSRAERRAAQGAAWRLFDFDQTHQVLLVASVELPAGFRAGPRLRAGTGFPRTPVLGAVYDARVDAWQPTRGAHNGERLPGFFQLDLRAEKAFRWSPATVTVSLDVVNVTNTPNAEEVTWSHDYQERQFLTGLPLLVVLGARVEL